MTFAQRRNRLTTHFSQRIPVVKRRIYICTQWHTHTHTQDYTVSHYWVSQFRNHGHVNNKSRTANCS